MDKFSGNFIAHLDATGSIIKESGRRIYLYALCAKIPVPKIKALPLLQWISDRHDSRTIKSFLCSWIDTIGDILPFPSIIVSDMSWANMNAIARAFNGQTLCELINDQWQQMHGKNKAQLF